MHAQDIEETQKAFLPKMKEVEEELAKKPDDPELIAKKKEYEEALKRASQGWVKVQVRAITLLMCISRDTSWGVSSRIPSGMRVCIAAHPS